MDKSSPLIAKVHALLAQQRPGLVLAKFGLLSTLVGTLVAIGSVPGSFAEPGQLRFPAIALTVGLLLAPLVAALRDLRSIVRAENVLASAPAYWLLLDLIQGRYGISVANRDDVIMAFGATGLFSMGVWLAALHRAWPLPRLVDDLSRREFTPGKTLALTVVCFCLGVFYFLFMAGFDLQVVVDSLKANRTGAAWSRNTAEGGWMAFVEHLAYFGMLLPALAVVLGRTTGWVKPATLLGWVLALTYAVFQAQGGNRRYLGVMFGAAVVVWLITENKPKWYHSILVAASAAVMLFAMEFVLEFRHEGVEMITEAEEGGESLVDMSTIRVDDNFLRLAQTVHFVPSYHPYVWHEYAFFAVIRPIPRVLWPGKPLAPSFRVHDFIEIGASLSSAVVGEAYASGGLIGVLLFGWLYGRLGVWGQALLAPPRTMPRNILYGAWLMAVFAGCRSMQDLVMMSYVVLALIAVLWMSRNWLEPAPDPSLQILNLLRSGKAAPRPQTAVFPSKTHIGAMARPATMPRRRPREEQ